MHTNNSELHESSINICVHSRHSRFNFALISVSLGIKIVLLNKTLGYNYPFRMANPLEVYFEE